MLENAVIVCFGEDLGGNPFSKYHIMKRLAAHNRVIYVEGIGARLPTLSLRDLRRVASKLMRVVRPSAATAGETNTPIPANFDVIHPFVIPWHTNQVVRNLNARILKWQITHSPLWNPTSPLVMWIGNPAVPERLMELNPRVTVYHCADKLIATANPKHRAIFDQMHQFWLSHAQLSLTPSVALRAELAEVSPNAQLLPHGVDFEMFSRSSSRDTQIPHDIEAIPQPIAGYFGTISLHWFDAGLVADVARRRPEISFVFIGPCYDGIAEQPELLLPNIHFLGPRLYRDLPRYAAAFSVCIIPKVKTELTAASMPLKLREYLATGKPVVSTLQQGDGYEQYVSYAPDAETFIQALDTLIESDSPERSKQRQMRVSQDSWDSVVQKLSNQLADLT